MSNDDKLNRKIAVNIVETVLERIKTREATEDDIKTLIKDINKYREIDGFDAEIARLHGSVFALLSDLSSLI